MGLSDGRRSAVTLCQQRIDPGGIGLEDYMIVAHTPHRLFLYGFAAFGRLSVQAVSLH